MTLKYRDPVVAVVGKYAVPSSMLSEPIQIDTWKKPENTFTV